MSSTEPTRVCFVCLGNICRSPTAEAVLVHRLREAGLEQRVVVESAGTAGWHVGEPADDRARAEAARRGVTMDGRGQQFGADDFARFDLVVAMDAENEATLRRLAPDDEAAGKIRRLTEFGPDAETSPDVPDPYYGGEDGFGLVYELIDRSCRGLIEHLRAR